jgi:hypothetical protein
MSTDNVRSIPNAEDTSREPDAANETVAERARRLAERIRRLPDDVVAAFAFTDSRERMSKLKEIQSELSFSMLPVISWLDRSSVYIYEASHVYTMS